MTQARRLTLGLAYLLVLVLAVGYALAMNRGTFEQNTPIDVISDRAGLTLASGARVKFRGVDVGKVVSIEPVASGARIGVDLFEDQVGFVPANVTAQIVPPTAFGAKYVQLESSTVGDVRPIAAGAQVRATQVTTEFNDAFANLTTVLEAMRPERVNRALTAGASVLNGRGEKLGSLVAALEQYLRVFNSSLPELSDVLDETVPVVEVYDDAADDLVTVLDNFGTVSETVTDRRSALGDLLSSTSSVSARAQSFLDTNQPGINRVVRLYDPVTGVLARYSPELPCFLGGLVNVNGIVENAFGGKRPGFYTYSRFLPNEPSYKPPANLPLVREDRGPACYGLPVVDAADAAREMPSFDVGAEPDLGPEQPSAGGLGDVLFGPLADLAQQP